MERFIISILVANHSGVLSRVSGMFTRRGFNIDTLTVGETESPEFSRITISMHDDEAICNQIVKQLEKMYDVKKVQVMKLLQENCCSSRLKTTLRNGRTSCQLLMSSVQKSRTTLQKLWSLKSVVFPQKSMLLLSCSNHTASWKCAGRVWLLLKEAAIA